MSLFEDRTAFAVDNPPLAHFSHLTLADRVRTSVRADTGRNMVVLSTEGPGFAGEALLPPDVALDLSLRLIGAVGRLRRLDRPERDR